MNHFCVGIHFCWISYNYMHVVKKVHNCLDLDFVLKILMKQC